MSNVGRGHIRSQSGFTTAELLVSLGVSAVILLAAGEGILRFQELGRDLTQRTQALGSRLILGQLIRDRGDALCVEIGFGPGEGQNAPTEKQVQDLLESQRDPGHSSRREEPLPGIFSVRTFSAPSDLQPNLSSAINAAPKGTSLSFVFSPEFYRCHPGKIQGTEICESVLRSQTRLSATNRIGTNGDSQEIIRDAGKPEKYLLSLEVDLGEERLIRGCRMQLHSRNLASVPPSVPKRLRRSGIINLGQQGANLGSDCEKITLIGQWQSNAGDHAPFQGHVTRQRNGKYRWVGIGTGGFYGDYELTSERRCLSVGNPVPNSLIIGCLRVNDKNEVIVDLGPQTRTSYGASQCAYANEVISACIYEVNVKGSQDTDIVVKASVSSPGPCKVGDYASQQGTTLGVAANPGGVAQMHVQSSPWAFQADTVILCPEGTKQENCTFDDGSGGPLGRMTCRCLMENAYEAK